MSHRLTALLTEAREALGESQDRLVALFDSLKSKQKIKVAMTAVMGSGKYTDGQPHEWLVGRRARSKKYGSETITLMPVDGSWKPTKYNAFKLWKKKSSRDGETYISASQGDMGLMLKSINGISAK